MTTLDRVLEIAVPLVLALLIAALTLPLTGCGMLTGRGIAFNGSIHSVDETEFKQSTKRKGSPLACIWNDKYCTDKEEQGS